MTQSAIQAGLLRALSRNDQQDAEVDPDTELTDDKLRAYLEHLRWPDGVRCPRCNSERVFRVAGRDQFNCGSCRYQFSVTAGSIFNHTQLPLWKWFLAVYLMCESRTGTSANKIARPLGVSYKTAWYLCHRIRKAMAEAGSGEPGASAGVRRSITALHHGVSAKHLDRYIEEFEFRSNNRGNPLLFRDTLARLATTGKMDYKELTA